MGFLFRIFLIVVIAVGVGFGASYYALTDGRVIGSVSVGPWAAWPQIGQSYPDPYSRAYLAREGFLQLGESEGIQFVANEDSSGDPLDRACHYALEGSVPTADFWTLAATTPQGAIVSAAPETMALHSDRLALDRDGSVNVHVSPSLAPGNWLEIDGDGAFQLILTLYDAAVFSGGTTAISGLPSITRVDCP
ncbi:DUF1214 domain-containing protein [Pelagibacterium montanilacus]|uniref:DUF1214 domain-containing protein n=1 Tax=Pelagibacterium montanilacus TaxID=2185280 RepID=UPI000F8E0904|nr:DUF1214 domain-containing protein [Pelagibacterium montanilacus]